MAQDSWYGSHVETARSSGFAGEPRGVAFQNRLQNKKGRKADEEKIFVRCPLTDDAPVHDPSDSFSGTVRGHGWPLG
jgi:hypothetical protein